MKSKSKSKDKVVKSSIVTRSHTKKSKNHSKQKAIVKADSERKIGLASSKGLKDSKLSK